MRSLPDWRGKTDDTAVPPRVALRVLEAYGHRCYLSGREISSGDQWQVEHRVALALGGANAESNLAPVLIEPHREKTRADVKIKAKIARIQKRRFGLARSKHPMRHPTLRRRMDGTVERRT